MHNHRRAAQAEFDPFVDTGAVPSPCINICTMRPDGLCEGCLRTLDEIVQWGSAGESFKRAVWVEIGQRELAVNPLEHKEK